jgi:hypothetical protein
MVVRGSGLEIYPFKGEDLLECDFGAIPQVHFAPERRPRPASAPRWRNCPKNRITASSA